MTPRPGFFRGRELPSLVILGVLLVGGWLAVWVYLNRPGRVSDEKPARQVKRDPLPPPDDHIELQAVVDRASLNPRENPAYQLLLDRTRSIPPEQLAAQSRRDVLYGQVLKNPARYRGIPIHIQGTALRIQEEFVQDSVLFPKGVYYEAWVGTNDSRPYFWHIIFENPPDDLPIGDLPGAQLAFDGYFFKLQRYLASNKRAAVEPLLIGRLQRVDLDQPASNVKDRDAGWQLDPLWIGVFAAIFGFGILRWHYMSRAFNRRRTAPPHAALPVTDQIYPAALSDWLNNPRDDDVD